VTTRLLLVRHGESEHHVRGVVGGPRGDTGLTENGRAQGRSVATRLARSIPAPVRLFTSPLPRAVETADLIAAAYDMPPPTQHCGLCSYHVPDHHDGIAVADLWANQLHGGSAYRPYEEGNEPWMQLLARVGAALGDIAIECTGATAVVVTHNEAIQASLTAFAELPVRKLFDVWFNEASITEWVTDDDPAGTGYPTWSFPRWRLVRLNDTAHIE
jgi:broad specificity phosphatase PhoE